MKKYLVGFTALILAVSLSAFTMHTPSVQKKGGTEVWYFTGDPDTDLYDTLAYDDDQGEMVCITGTVPCRIEFPQGDGANPGEFSDLEEFLDYMSTHTGDYNGTYIKSLRAE